MTMRSFSIIGLLGTAMLMACADQDDSTTDERAPLVGGSGTFARPEVGYLTAGCTATLVDAQYIITAAHCFNYTNGPRNDSFEMTTTGGTALPGVKVDYAYMTGTELGTWDFAFGRLASVVAGTTAFPAFIGGAPATNEQVSAFGYGCTDRSTGAGGGVKRFVNYTVGAPTQMNCPKDSGGPRFHGLHTGTGSIWGINSGYDGSGNDIFGSAWDNAPAVLRGVKWFGGTSTTNLVTSTFPGKAQQSGVKVVSGDFNGDGFGDLAAVGGSGWTTVPVAFGNGTGGFTVTDLPLSNFPFWATQAKSVVAADFNADGATDIALLGGPNWTSIPIAFSGWNGTFTVTNQVVANLPQWSGESGVKAVAGDFDADGDGDIALMGGAGWSSIPMGFSNRDGTFAQTNTVVASFPTFAKTPGAQPFAGDFDGDGDADIALTGPAGWAAIPVAFSNRAGGFSVTNAAVDIFPGWASTAAVKVAVGDFDGDGDADLAAVGGNGRRSIGFALSNGSGGFLPAHLPSPEFTQWGATAPFALGVRSNHDHASDIILAGGSGWTSIPVAYLKASRIVTQSSTWSGNTADRANDGNTGGNLSNGSVSSTDFEAQPWWQADLGVQTKVGWVQVYNRTDCCSDRLTNFNVSVSQNGSTWTTTNVPGQGQLPTVVSFGTWARYVRVQLVGTNYLSLAEVKVLEQ
jgi:hypothetical protein